MNYVMRNIRVRVTLTTAIAFLLAAEVRAFDGPNATRPGEISAEGLKPIGGHWFVKEGATPSYFYKDGDRMVDPFSYHVLDSNNDGIPNIKLSHEGDFLKVESQGYPNHPTAVFPNSRNPNTIRVQQFRFRLPLVPRKADKITRVPMGPIGMALNGVVFFNPFEAGGMNAIEGYSEVWLDSCCGHPQQTGVYHYHKYPSCVKTPFADDAKSHSPIIGFAFDGFPLYGPYEAEGLLAKDLTGDRALDVCNGHDDPVRGYHYHVTPKRFPYLIGGYAGVPEPSNNPMMTWAGNGAILNNAKGDDHDWAAIDTVIPGNLKRGRTEIIRVVLNPNKGRGGIPDGLPSWVQFGPFEAKKVTREGNTLNAEVEVTEDAARGIWLDATIEFPPKSTKGRPRVFKKNDVVRVTE